MRKSASRSLADLTAIQPARFVPKAEVNNSIQTIQFQLTINIQKIKRDNLQYIIRYFEFSGILGETLYKRAH